GRPTTRGSIARPTAWVARPRSSATSNPIRRTSTGRATSTSPSEHRPMTRSFVSPRGLRAFGLSALVALLPLPGCTHDLVQVTDPDIIPDVNTPSGALALKNGVIFRLEQVTAGLGGNGPDNLFIYGGLLADEWRSGDTFVQRNDMDQRLFDPTNTFLAGPLRALNRVRAEGRTAIEKLRVYAPTPVSNVGLMFALTAFVDNLAGEYY